MSLTIVRIMPNVVDEIGEPFVQHLVQIPRARKDGRRHVKSKMLNVSRMNEDAANSLGGELKGIVGR